MNQSDRKNLMTIMAKEKTPIGKVVVQQNIISQKLIKSIQIVSDLNTEKYSTEKLSKMTLGGLVTLFITNFTPVSKKTDSLLEMLSKYNIGRNHFIHKMNDGKLYEANTNDIYHETKQLHLVGNRIIGKLNSLNQKIWKKDLDNKF